MFALSSVRLQEHIEQTSKGHRSQRSGRGKYVALRYGECTGENTLYYSMVCAVGKIHCITVWCVHWGKYITLQYGECILSS
jgi:hypothetical protein